MELLSLCVLLLLANSCLALEVKCVHEDGNFCRCTATSAKLNMTLDISDLFDYPMSVQGGDYTYTYRACEAKPCKEGGTAARLCQVGKTTDFNVGVDIASGDWTITKEDPLEFVIQYTGGDGKSPPRKSTVTFTHGTGDNEFKFVSGQSSVYEFTVTGKGVAPYTPTPHHHSGGGGGGNIAGPIGLALISLFIIAVVAYFVTGALINYFHRGARGVEVIPNYTFWKDVPFLIKDGFLFTISPCYKRGDKYQSL